MFDYDFISAGQLDNKLTYEIGVKGIRERYNIIANKNISKKKSSFYIII